MNDFKGVELGLQYAADNRKSEIALLWSRSLYFWGLIAVLLTAYGAAFQSGHKTIAVFAACFGFLCSLSWSLANRSGKFWQETWEKKTEYWERLAVEVGVLYRPLFDPKTNPTIKQCWFWGKNPYSPSKLATAISDFSVVGWVLLITGTILSRLTQGLHCFQVVAAYAGNIVAVMFTFIGAATLMLCCRSSRN